MVRLILEAAQGASAGLYRDTSGQTERRSRLKIHSAPARLLLVWRTLGGSSS